MAWTSALAPTSMPRVGSSRISTAGCVLSHLLSITFCWLPPESLATGEVDRRACGSRAARGRPPPWRAPSRVRDQAEAVEVAPQHRQRDVGRDRHRQRQAELAAVLGDVGDAERHRLARRCGSVTRLAVEHDRPRGRRRDAEEGEADIGAPGADQAGEAQHLAAVQVEADVLEDARRGRARAPRAAARRARPAAAAEAAPTSRPTMSAMALAGVASARGRRRDQPPVAEDGDAVGDLEHLLHAVADEQDRDALVAQRRARA